MFICTQLHILVLVLMKINTIDIIQAFFIALILGCSIFFTVKYHQKIFKLAKEFFLNKKYVIITLSSIAFLASIYIGSYCYFRNTESIVMEYTGLGNNGCITWVLFNDSEGNYSKGKSHFGTLLYYPLIWSEMKARSYYKVNYLNKKN